MTAQLRVLNFHDFAGSRNGGCYPVALLERCLRLLRRRGFESVELASSVGRLQAGEGLPERSIAITFDDGYRSVYRVAYPLLQELGYTATLFVVTGRSSAEQSTALPTIDGRDMLRWAEVREMQRAGFSVGSHSVSHVDMRSLSRSRMVSELSESKKLLEDRLGARVQSFAYPFGRYDANVRSLTLEHYDCAFSDHLRLVDSRSDPFGLERIDMRFFDRDLLLRLLPSRLLPSYLGLRRLGHRPGRGRRDHAGGRA